MIAFLLARLRDPLHFGILLLTLVAVIMMVRDDAGLAWLRHYIRPGRAGKKH